MINHLNEMFFAVLLLIVGVFSSDPHTCDAVFHAEKICPDIINELKDFKDLIPESKVDTIIAEHLVLDGNFRKAFKFVRSNEFKHLAEQLLCMPEVIQVLDFLHLTVNATMVSSWEAETKATAAHAKDSLAVQESSSSVNNNVLNKKITNAKNTGPDILRVNPIDATHPSAVELQHLAALVYKTPQLEELERTIYDDEEFPAELPIVDIVQLQENEVATNDDDISDHHLHQHDNPLGTFTSFVEDIIAQLPHTEYQHMITQKCAKNAKFANFYAALRSSELQPMVDEAMKSANIMKVIKTLSANDIDVRNLEPLAFKVISWGP